MTVKKYSLPVIEEFPTDTDLQLDEKVRDSGLSLQQSPGLGDAGSPEIVDKIETMLA